MAFDIDHILKSVLEGSSTPEMLDSLRELDGANSSLRDLSVAATAILEATWNTDIHDFVATLDPILDGIQRHVLTTPIDDAHPAGEKFWWFIFIGGSTLWRNGVPEVSQRIAKIAFDQIELVAESAESDVADEVVFSAIISLAGFVTTEPDLGAAVDRVVDYVAEGVLAVLARRPVARIRNEIYDIMLERFADSVVSEMSADIEGLMLLSRWGEEATDLTDIATRFPQPEFVVPLQAALASPTLSISGRLSLDEALERSEKLSP